MIINRLAKLTNPFFVYKNRHKIFPFTKRQIHQVEDRFTTFMAVHGIPLTQNDKRILTLKDKHKDKRCFIIGNGPSLKIEDLDRLKNEITFASNKIYLAFDQTDWRPLYYTVDDLLVAENNHVEIDQLNLTKIFCIEGKKYFSNITDVIWFRLRADLTPGKRFDFSTELLIGVYPGHSVIYDQIQIAFYMGIREMYLIGVDFSFIIPKPVGNTYTVYKDGEILESQGEVNHFHPNYRKPGETWTMPRLDLQRPQFAYGKEFIEHQGGRIYNASRRTKLDIFPRINFDDLFPIS